jgi:putative hydrolase of the HAD superfamily
MGCMKLPRAILFDLNDTLLVAFGPAQSQWRRTIAVFADQLGPIEATVIAAAIEAALTELWADPARHKYWRHRTGAFAALAVAGHPAPPEPIGDALADAYNALQDEESSLFPDAHETLDRFKDNAMRRRKLHLQPYSGRRGDAHDWFPRPMAGTPSNAVTSGQKRPPL